MSEAKVAIEESGLHDSFNELYFKKLVSGFHRPLSKLRRIDVLELLELAWADGTLEPTASRLIRSRPDLAEEVATVLSGLAEGC